MIVVANALTWHGEILLLAHGVTILTAMCGVTAFGCRCVAGNCFSLQREHESAVRLFQRALQLDPHMSYAGMASAAIGGDSGSVTALARSVVRHPPRKDIVALLYPACGFCHAPLQQQHLHGESCDLWCRVT
jgi:hypothetical protein